MKTRGKLFTAVFIFVMIWTTSIFAKDIGISLNGSKVKTKAILEQGTSYLPLQFYKDYLECDVDIKALTIVRSDAVIWLSDRERIYNAQINYRYDASVPLVKKINNVPYIKATSLSKFLNYSVSFDNKSSILNISYSGPRTAKDVYLSDEQFVTVSGYVYDKNCKPVKGAKVELSPQRKDGSIYDPQYALEKEFGLKECPVTYTDENGYYEFLNVDSEKIPCLGVYAEKIIDGKLYISERNGSELFKDEILGVKTVKMGAIGYITKQEKLPPIYMIEKPKDW